MNNSQNLSSKIKEVYLEGKWIANTNLKDALSDVEFDTAMHVYKKLNSIAALTFHLNYYLEGLLFYIQEGELTMHDSFSFAINENMNEQEWEELKQKLFSNALEFSKIIAGWSEAQLQEDFYQNQYGSWQRGVEGVVEHGYYHLGQIVLIKKLIAQ
ncbi:MAG: DinB family protein [Bacteroidota bacterium]